ncbi:hypothetical protein H4R99_003114 [Coemansia sp. RSA 1722]|nr:hypothetical protein LPJ57_005820 [Coemansia sp. RSA 486]KAJ2597245.1 hypothetical protein GGF39_003128 [Coemansia sp. RSA 1721]KAJ2601099.1 hypothetical protein H4R99_003114 [Coemansia sp. RSA 1722]
MGVQYGFLQGTFGLPYGGYCIRPQNLGDIVLNADSPQSQMFCVIGKYSEVMGWLENNDRMVSNQCTSHDTFTHDLTVEMYSKTSSLVRIIRGKRNIDVQLVIRIARTWDRKNVSKSSSSSQFKPMVKGIVPSGVTLAEIKCQFAEAPAGTLVDATVDKALLDVVLTRVSSRSSTIASNQQQQTQPIPGSPSSSFATTVALLPVYEHTEELPPDYY